MFIPSIDQFECYHFPPSSAAKLQTPNRGLREGLRCTDEHEFTRFLPLYFPLIIIPLFFLPSQWQHLFLLVPLITISRPLAPPAPRRRGKRVVLPTRRLPSHLMFLGGINGTSADPTVVPDASMGAARERLVMGGPSGGMQGENGVPGVYGARDMGKRYT